MIRKKKANEKAEEHRTRNRWPRADDGRKNEANDLDYVTLTSISKDLYTSFVTAAIQRRDERPRSDPMDAEFANTLFINLVLSGLVLFFHIAHRSSPRYS